MPAHSLPPGLVETIRNVRSVGVITGAGMSAESGVQTYRGKGGIYDDPIEGDRTVEALSAATLRADPDRSWRTIARLAEQACDARPNPGHVALVAIEQAVESFVLLTQNVDGLHRAAGNENVIEIHGTVREVVCLKCSYRAPMAEVLVRLKAGERDPDCRSCGGILKSATISFGQSLVPEDLACAEQAVRQCDVLLAIGSSLSVYPVAGLVPLAQDCGAKIVIINATPTDMDPIADVVLLGNISDVLPALF